MNEPHKWEFRPPPGGDVGEELVICRDKVWILFYLLKN